MMDQFLLECAEEALHAGVVPTVALATHRTFDAVLPQDLLVARSGVLAAPVRVMQESGAGLAAPQRHRECLLGEIDREPLPHRPADDLAGKEVEHHGEIEPALVRPDVGDVAGPYPVWLLDPKLPVQGVGRHRELVARFGRGTPLLHGLGADALGAHEPRHAVLAKAMAAFDERIPDAGTAVGLPGLPVNRTNLNQYPAIGQS